jgi:hypothetical protein
MKISRVAMVGAVMLASAMEAQHASLQQQNEALFRALQRVHALSDAQMTAIRQIFAGPATWGKGIPP